MSHTVHMVYDRYLSIAMASSIVLASTVPSSGTILFTFSSSGISRWLSFVGGNFVWNKVVTWQTNFYWFDQHALSSTWTLPFGLIFSCSCSSCSFWSSSSIWARVTFPPDAASFWALPLILALSSSRSRWFSFFLSNISSLFFSLSSCRNRKIPHQTKYEVRSKKVTYLSPLRSRKITSPISLKQALIILTLLLCCTQYI